MKSKQQDMILVSTKQELCEELEESSVCVEGCPKNDKAFLI